VFLCITLNNTGRFAMLFRRELIRNLKSFIITMLINGFMIVYCLAIGKKMGVDIQQIIDLKFPEQLQAAFGFSGLNYSQGESILALAFSYIYLFLAIYLAGLFANIVSKEYRDKTAEYLFSLPSPKITIVLTKLYVALIYLLLSTLTCYVIAYFSAKAYYDGNFNMKVIFLMSLAWLMGGLVFGAISFFISSFYSYSKSIGSITVGIVMVMYLFQVVISLNDDLEKLKYISPFDWFKGDEILQNLSLNSTYVIIALGISALCLVIGIHRFNKKEVLV